MPTQTNSYSKSSAKIKNKSVKIAVASGKGGTGKTTVSVNLFHFLSKYLDRDVILADCDVEEPNDILFFSDLVELEKKEIHHIIPEIDIDKCTFCKKCSDWCEFNAITIINKIKFAEISSDLCHSCGACTLACPEDAIIETKKTLGTITHYATDSTTKIIEGRLKIGSAMQTMMIQNLKNDITENGSVIIYDAPPGTSCSVVQTVADVDYVLLVTEPTPFGLHDLKITVALLDKLNINYGVIVNKAGIGNADIYKFLNDKKIELLGNIPFNKSYSSNYSSGRILDKIPHELEEFYLNLVQKLNLELLN